MSRVCISYDTGNGRLGGHHTHLSFCGLPGVEIAALANANRKDDAGFIFSGAKKRYYDWKEMIVSEKPDIVVFCSRLPLEHYEQIDFAIDHGCHVLCEKPLATDLVQADDLIRRAKEKDILIQVGHLARFAPAFQEMKRKIEANEIGTPLSCLMRGKEDLRGGGEDMMVLGTHLLDISCYLFGMPDEVSADVRFQGRPIHHGETLPTREPVGLCGGDQIFARFHFPCNVTGVFESRRGMINMPQDGCERMGITVTGTTGALTIRYVGKRELRICRDFPVPIEDSSAFVNVELPAAPGIPGAKPFILKDFGMEDWAIHRYFCANNRRAAWNLLQAIEGEEKLLSSAENARASLEMIEGTYASSMERRILDLPLANRKHPLEKESC